MVIIEKHWREHRIDGTLKIQINSGFIFILQQWILGKPEAVPFK